MKSFLIKQPLIIILFRRTEWQARRASLQTVSQRAKTSLCPFVCSLTITCVSRKKNTNHCEIVVGYDRLFNIISKIRQFSEQKCCQAPSFHPFRRELIFFSHKHSAECVYILVYDVILLKIIGKSYFMFLVPIHTFFL